MNAKQTMTMLAMLGLGACVPAQDKPEPFDGTGTEQPDTTAANSQTNPDVLDPVTTDPVATPPDVVIPTPTAPGSLNCASAFVSHDGSYYAAGIWPAEGGTYVEISLVRPGTSAFDEVEPGEEIVWSDTVPSEVSAEFFGFEAPEMFLVVEASDTPGILVGTMEGESEVSEGPIAVTCWSEDLALPATYDSASGKCLDATGHLATNEIPFIYAVRTGFGQCATLEGQLNGDAFGYPDFVALDLRGSDLTGAALNFANLTDARLEGADMSTFEFGYATIEGSIDERTVLPGSMFCGEPIDGDAFSCTQ